MFILLCLEGLSHVSCLSFVTEGVFHSQFLKITEMYESTVTKLSSRLLSKGH